MARHFNRRLMGWNDRITSPLRRTSLTGFQGINRIETNTVVPANTRCSPSVGLMLARRRASINPTLGERLLLAGKGGERFLAFARYFWPCLTGGDGMLLIWNHPNGAVVLYSSQWSFTVDHGGHVYTLSHCPYVESHNTGTTYQARCAGAMCWRDVPTSCQHIASDGSSMCCDYRCYSARFSYQINRRRTNIKTTLNV